VLPAVKRDVSPDPRDVGPLRPAAVVPCPQRAAADQDQGPDASGRARLFPDEPTVGTSRGRGGRSRHRAWTVSRHSCQKQELRRQFAECGRCGYCALRLIRTRDPWACRRGGPSAGSTMTARGARPSRGRPPVAASGSAWMRRRIAAPGRPCMAPGCAATSTREVRRRGTGPVASRGTPRCPRGSPRCRRRAPGCGPPWRSPARGCRRRGSREDIPS
jgi:hypothetical protein